MRSKTRATIEDLYKVEGKAELLNGEIVEKPPAGDDPGYASYEQLEFVLLERVVSRSQSRRAALKQAIRPIPLTVNRLDRDLIALRMLKRFTFTEEDAAHQWEKLRSASMLAEWSEEYFNSRALFSDYYLKEHLTDLKIRPDWNDDVRPIGHDLYKHLITARKNYTRQPGCVIRKSVSKKVANIHGSGVTCGVPQRPSNPCEVDVIVRALPPADLTGLPQRSDRPRVELDHTSRARGQAWGPTGGLSQA